MIGTTTQGREIVAVRITQKPKKGGKRAKDRPAVLYQGTTHAREWISTEVTRRLMQYFAGNSTTARKLRRQRELWFVPVVNPDGYQYTFDHERLWRKNLRDNDGDEQITNLDGVDINRNYPEHWGYDDEGSEPEISSDTYRGPSAASEPETQASINLVRRIDPVLTDSYHSYGPLLLYPEGWQVQTPARDLPVYLALSGNDEEPAVEGTDPDVSAELYTTNGEFTDWAHHEQDVLAWTSELNEGCEGCGFVFPDDEGLVQHEFEINLPFAIDMARSAADPAKPKSHLGNRTEPFYLSLTERGPHVLEQSPGGLPLQRLLRRSAAGRGARPQQRSRRHAQLPDQRRAHAQGRHPALERWRDLRRGIRHLLRDPARGRPRHRPGRLGRGLVHGQRPQQG